jgi:uncharacterized phage-associated protein
MSPEPPALAPGLGRSAPLPEKTEAWANAPVVREIYEAHRGMFKVSSWRRGRPEPLNEKQRETVDAVLGFYGHRTSHYYSGLC